MHTTEHNRAVQQSGLPPPAHLTFDPVRVRRRNKKELQLFVFFLVFVQFIQNDTVGVMVQKWCLEQRLQKGICAKSRNIREKS